MKAGEHDTSHLGIHTTDVNAEKLKNDADEPSSYEDDQPTAKEAKATTVPLVINVSNEPQKKSSEKTDDVNKVSTHMHDSHSSSNFSSSHSGSKKSSSGHESTDCNSLKKANPDPAFTKLMRLLSVDSPKKALAATIWLQTQKAMPEKEPPLSPGSYFRTISKVAYNKTSDQLKLENALVVRLTPRWNGKKDKFFHFQQHIFS